MPRKTARNVPGTERYRDERRGGGPRMHGRQWHDHDKEKDFEPEAMAGAGAIVGEPIEGSPNNSVEGMGRVRKTKKTSQGRVRRKRTTPVGKGPKAKTKKAVGSRRGAKATGRGGNPG
jgi:hypothetical protein